MDSRGEKVKKSYYAIIPASVRYDNELPMGARLLYGEITALCNEKGYCWATNKYFAELYDMSKKTISRWISKLEERGYIVTELIYKEKSKEVEERRIYINDTPRQECPKGIDKNVPTPRQECPKGIDKNVPTPMDKNVQENTTICNNTLNNTDDDEQPQKNKNNTNPYSFYEQNFGMLTPHIADRIKGMEEDIGETMVLIAMQEAIECGAFNIRYVETVVNSWLKNNITTPQAYMIHKTKHTAKKQRSKDRDKESRHVPSADETAEYLRKMRGDRNVATSKSGS